MTDVVLVDRSSCSICIDSESPPGMINSIVISTLYWFLCMPNMLKGIEEWPGRQAGGNLLEKGYNLLATCIQAFPI